MLLGMWPWDPRWACVTKEPNYEGKVLDYYDRPIGYGLEPFLDAVLEGCEIQRVDQVLLERSIQYDQHVAKFGSSEEINVDLMGFFLMRDDEILCEAVAGPVIRGTRGPGVDTYEAYRQKGYATITCASLIDACEKAGQETWWNCNTNNFASTALARKLGYREEKIYRLLGWFKKE